MEKEEKKDITIADVAEALGVSKTTVSRAISGKGRIGKETRKRVLEYIEEHDYKRQGTGTVENVQYLCGDAARL